MERVKLITICTADFVLLWAAVHFTPVWVLRCLGIAVAALCTWALLRKPKPEEFHRGVNVVKWP